MSAAIPTPETRAGLVRILESMKARDRIDAAILGGTELPILLKDADDVGAPFLDTTAIHVARITDEILS